MNGVIKKFKYLENEISYLQSGAGPLRLIFLHGLCGNKELWKHQIDYFSSNIEVLSIDLLGHGNSSPIEGSQFISASAKIIHQFIVQLPAKTQTCVIGHSLGGIILNELLAHSPLISRAVFVDSPCLYNSDMLKSYNDYGAVIGSADDLPKFIADWLEGLLTDECTEDIKSQVKNGGASVSGNWMAEIMQSLTAPKQELRENVKFSVMEGSENYPKDNSLSWSHLYPASSVWNYLGKGHFFFLEDPSAFNSGLQKLI